MAEKEWIIINYTVPKEPSRIRVSIWRKLKKRGSVSLGQSMWILPLSQENLEFFQEISADIFQNNGTSNIMEAAFISAENTEHVIEVFNQARDEEYSEFIEKCEDFFHEIEKETLKENYTFAEVEENEYEYNKLVEWYKNIIERDFFTAPRMKTSQQKLETCREMLENFSQKVYEISNEIN
jgi:DNA-binding transcriptional regulator PaaX